MFTVEKKDQIYDDVNENIFSEVIYTRWLRYVDASESTNTTYIRILKQFYLFLLKNGITLPTKEDIFNFKIELMKRTKPTTVSLYLTIIKNFFYWLEKEGIYKNIACEIKNIKIDKTHKRDALTALQVYEIIQNMDNKTIINKRNYAIFLLLVTTGLRTIEVTRANMEDIRNIGGNTVLFIQSKGHFDKTEYVKITPEVYKAIRDYLVLLPDKSKTDALFTSYSNNSKGNRLSTRTLRTIIKELLKQNGFASCRLSAHSLRHTTATINLLNGGTLEETQQLLRHKNIVTTMIYNHSLQRINNNSEYRIANAIFKSKQKELI